MSTNKIIFGALVFVTLGSLFAVGCTTYLEKETPKGQVPPPAFISPRTGGTESESQAVPETSRSKLEADMEGTRKHFAEVYVVQKQPRIVVYVNRELSDDVREWSSNYRLVTEGEIEVERAGVSVERGSEKVGPVLERGAERVGASAGKVKGKNGVFSEETRVSDDRPAPPENWMWQMEDSFFGPFLKAKAVLVDRSTILRLASSDVHAGSSPAQTQPSVKQVEMAAIKDKADLLMELLVRRNPQAPAGYEFRVNVKEIKSGRILAKASSLAWKQEEQKYVLVAKYQATEHGYVRVGNDSFPRLDRVTALLAHDVMQQLISMWARE